MFLIVLGRGGVGGAKMAKRDEYISLDSEPFWHLQLHLAYVNPWLFTKTPLDFVHLLLKCGSRTEATHLSLENFKNIN